MAKCEKCGKEYYTRECLKCKDKIKIYPSQQKMYQTQQTNNMNKKELSEKEKLFKVIRYTIIIILGMFIIGTIIEVYYVNKVVNKTEPLLNEVNKMSLEMMKSSNKMMEKLNK